MGGRSPEHEISVLSGQQVVANLNKNKYEVLPIVISKSGKWQLTSKEEIVKLESPIGLKGTSREIVLSTNRQIKETTEIKNSNVDVVFIAMHGPYGEDGTIQGMLELSNIKYTGSGVLSSSLCMDKEFFRQLMKSHKYTIPKYICINKSEKLDEKEVLREVGPGPYFVKPVAGGSSIGSAISQNLKELDMSVKLAFKYDDRVLIDEYIKGLELTCAVLGNENPKALPVIEIHPLKGDFFDYNSKYSDKGSEEIVPARISKSLTIKVQDLAIKVYKSVGCRGFGRVDFILKDDKTPVILEINTIPGLTQMSLLPKAAKAAGITYKQLLDIIIDNALVS